MADFTVTWLGFEGSIAIAFVHHVLREERRWAPKHEQALLEGLMLRVKRLDFERG